MAEENECLTEDLDDVTPFSRVFAIVSLCAVFFTVVVLGVTFFIQRNQYLILRARANFLTVAYVLGCLWSIGWNVDSLMNRSGFPCPLFVNLRMLIATLVGGSAVISALRVYFRFRLNLKMVELEVDRADASTMNDHELAVPTPASEELETKTNPKAATQKSTSFLGSQSERFRSVAGSLGGKLPPKHLFYLSDTKFMSGVMLFLVVVGLIVGIIQGIEVAGCETPCGVEIPLSELLFLAVLILMIAGGVSFFMWQVRNEPDPLGFRKQFYLFALVSLLFVLPVLVLTVADPKDLTIRGELIWSDFFGFVSALWVLLWLGYPLWLVRNLANEKLALDEFGVVSLEAVLESKTASALFKAFLVRELNVEHYIFWQDVTSYKLNFGKKKKKFNKNARQKIIDTYLSNNAPFPVNISYADKQLVLKRIDEEPAPDDFDYQLQQVIDLLELDSFRRFIQTDAFRDLRWQNTDA